MKKMMQSKKGQKGFTLIEIIAVLVILGILAAVAAPRYFNLQTQARQSAVNAAAGEVQARINQRFAQQILNNVACATAAVVPLTAIQDAAGEVSGWTVTGTWGTTAGDNFTLSFANTAAGVPNALASTVDNYLPTCN